MVTFVLTWEVLIMKNDNIKGKRINIRVNNSEYEILKNKAKEANVSVSTYLRDVGLNGKVNHLDNGKEIAQKIGLLHNKIQLYQQDISAQIDALKNILNENNQLLKNVSSLNQFEIANVLKYQNMRINAVLENFLYSYAEQEKKLETELHDTISKELI